MTATEQTKTSELLPCPFCGGEAMMRKLPRIGVWRVSCKHCDASPNGSLTEAQAVTRWNRRATPSHTALEALRPWGTAPEDGTVILAFRADAGWFTAHYVEEDAHLSSPMNPPEGDCYWFTTSGEDLTGDLPTLWTHLPSYGAALASQEPRQQEERT